MAQLIRGLFIFILFSFSIQIYSINVDDLESIYKKVLIKAGVDRDIPKLKVSLSNIITANYNYIGNYITITTAMLSTSTKAEVEFVLLHEIYHYLSGTGGTWDSEMDADMYAKKLMGKKGCKGAKIIEVFVQDNEHPSGIMRYKTLNCR